MATSIHAHAEIKIGKKWHHHSRFKIGECYSLFNKVAGIRREDYLGTPIVEPKGIPEGLTKITQMYLDRLHEDAHTHTWFNSSEIDEFMKWLTKDGGYDYMLDTFGYVFGQYWIGFLENEYKPKDIEDVRFIFWFDN